MRFDLGTEPENHAPVRREIEVVRGLRQCHGVACERNGNGGSELNAFGVFSREQQWEERFVGTFERVDAVESQRFEATRLSRNRGQTLRFEWCVDLQWLLPKNN